MNAAELITLINQLAHQTAEKHRPHGFSARAFLDAFGSPQLEINYLTKESPRFEVTSELVQVANEITDSVAVAPEADGARVLAEQLSYASDSSIHIPIKFRSEA